jgi:hypothetical protein
MGTPTRHLISRTAVVAAVFLAASGSAQAATQIAVKATPAYELAPGTGGGTYFAWTRGSRARLLLQSGPGQPAFQVNGSRSRAFSGSIDGTTFVYQLAHGNNSDIRLMDVVSHVKSAPTGINTRRWEWHPTVSGDWILFGREAAARNRWRVLLHNTSTDQTITLADVQGKTTRADPGQVSGDYAVWDRCAHHVCNVYRYQISTGQTTRIPNTLTGQIQYFPSVTGTGTAYFIHSGDGCGRNVKLVEWVEGQPLNVLVEFGPGRDITTSTQAVPDQVAGTDVYFDKYTCRTVTSDIYKIVVP